MSDIEYYSIRSQQSQQRAAALLSLPEGEETVVDICQFCCFVLYRAFTAHTVTSPTSCCVQLFSKTPAAVNTVSINICDTEEHYIYHGWFTERFEFCDCLNWLHNCIGGLLYVSALHFAGSIIRIKPKPVEDVCCVWGFDCRNERT